MRNEDIQRRESRRGGSFWPVAGAVALAVVLSGCSSVPDAANPVKWYTNTVDYFSGDKDAKAPAEEADKAVPGADQPFPNLATVPAKPEVSSAEERSRIAQGLVSDTERRRYAQDVARQGAPTNVLGSESSAPAPSAAGAPAALPALPAAPVPAQAQTQAQAPTPPATAAAPAAPATAPPAPAVRAPAPLAPSAATPPRVSAAPPAPAAPAMAPTVGVAPRVTPPASAEPFETVVVSSSGVDASADISAPPSTGGAMLAARDAGVADAGRSRGRSLHVATLQYANASSDLDSRDRAILRNVVALQRERGGIIRVVGHASHRTPNMDPVTHKLVNYDISSERAEMVAKALTELGARTQDIVVVAKADVEPLYYEVMPAGEAGNRRTEVYLDF